MGVQGNGKKPSVGGRWRALASEAWDALERTAARRGEERKNAAAETSGEGEIIDVAFTDEKKRSATRIWEEKKAEAEKTLENPAEARSVVANFKKWLAKFAPSGKSSPRSVAASATGAAFDGVKTLFRALEATFFGGYRGFSTKTLVALIAAALYCVAPIDALFDWIPGLGICDDIFVVAAALKAFAAETRTFKRWERTKAARELFTDAKGRLATIERVVLCPGWQSEEAPVDEIVEILRPVFPRATFERCRWPSNAPWKTAREYVDGEGVERLAQFLSTLPTEPAKIALIGHSLGARLTVRALARRVCCGEPPLGAAFLLGAAVDADDSELETAAKGVLAPLGNFYAAADRVLKYAYQTAEGRKPLGLRGAEGKWENYVDCEVSGDEEFWLELGENAASAASLLGTKALWVKFPLSAEVAAKAMEASRHRFAQYATFFRSVFDEENCF